MWTSDTLLNGGFRLSPRMRYDLVFQVYQDFQEYVFRRFQRPTSVIVREPDGSVRRCYSRQRYRGFCDFCRELRTTSGIPDDISVCVKEGNDFVLRGIAAEERGDKWDWGWQQCHMGLWDLFIPIRSVGEDIAPRPILAVLSMGHYRLQGNNAIRHIHSRIDAATTGKYWRKYFLDTSPAERCRYAHHLHELAEEIPVFDHSMGVAIRSELLEPVALMEFIATRTLNQNMLAQTDQFIDDLGLAVVDFRIGERALWEELETALGRILDRLPLSSAALYVSSHGDYRELRRRALAPQGVQVAESIGFPSLEHFGLLESRPYHHLPKRGHDFDWLDPKTYFGAHHALVFARQTSTGHMIIFGFGQERVASMNVYAIALLSEIIDGPILRFIERALFGIELDYLMSETGHLLGRAWGKVKAGYETLGELIVVEWTDREDEELARSSTWAIEDGLMRLELILQNFYAFRERRLGPNGQVTTEDNDIAQVTGEDYRSYAQSQVEAIDVVSLLNGLRDYFERSLEGTSDKALKFSLHCEEAVVVGQVNDLKLVFLNLWDNALKFSYAGTFVAVSVAIVEDRCVVQFGNLGIGVGPDERNRVFERLARSRFRDPVKRIEGLGLGLAFCRRVIEQQFKGEIYLSSRPVRTPRPRRFEGDNWVTTVTIRLPLTDQEVKDAENPLLR